VLSLFQIAFGTQIIHIPHRESTGMYSHRPISRFQIARLRQTR
jgi:hypothetical protein